MIKGRYNFEDTAFIDCNFAYEDMSSIIHEFMHTKLTISTLFGIVNFMLVNNKNKKIIKISRLFKESSTIVNENYALFYQIVFIKKIYKERYNEFINEFISSEYYYSYYGKRILKILSKVDVNDLLESRIIERIAFMAMNINFYELDSTRLLDEKYIENSLINKGYEFSPDNRYIKMLKALDSLLDKYNILDITDEILLKETNVNIIEANKENFFNILLLYKKQFVNEDANTNIIDSNIENIRKTDKDNFFIESVTEEDGYNIFDIVRPMSINNTFSIFNPERLEENHLKCEVLRILIDNKNVYATLLFLDVVEGNEYSFYATKDGLRKVLLRYKNSIVIFYEDYNIIKKDFPFLKDRKLFLEINNNYEACKKYISGEINYKKEAMIYQLNDGVFFLFVKQKDGNIFVMYFLNQVIRKIEKDIEDGFFYLVELDNNDLDGCFYTENTDWFKYEDVIRSIAKTYIMDRDFKFKTLGSRVLLNNNIDRKV